MNIDGKLIITALVAVAGALWWLVQRGDKAREKITDEYLKQVAAATETQQETAKAMMAQAEAMTQIGASIKLHTEMSKADHERICASIGTLANK